MVGLLVVVIAGGFTLWAFSSNMTPYVDVKTARASTGQVQVRGYILHDTAIYDARIGALKFMIKDDKGEKMQIVYRGAKPDAFDKAPETAALGAYRDGVFVSEQLIVKCPSKYDDSKKDPYKIVGAGGKA